MTLPNPSASSESDCATSLEDRLRLSVPSPSLRLNFSWTLAGNLGYAGTQWAILMVLARLGTPEAVGQFSLGLAITAPIMLFASLQLRAVQATDARHQFQFRDYASLRVLTTTLAISVIAAISWTLYRGETALTIAAFGLTKGIESLSDLFYGLWQQHERMDLIAKSLLLRGGFALVAVGISFALFHTVWVAVCAMAISWAGVFAGFDMRRGAALSPQVGKPVRPRFSAFRIQELVRLSLPLGIVTLLISFNGNVPRYMISHFRGIRELGIFSALGYVLMAGTMVVSALGQSATPRLALYASQGQAREFRRLSYRLLLIGVALGIGGIIIAWAFGREIITLAFGRQYTEPRELFPWLMVAAAVSYMASFCGYSLTAARHFRVQAPLFTGLTVVTLGLCYAMVRAGGAVGAAKALAIAGFVQLVATMAVLWRLESRRPARES